jgi:outer membrane protein
MGAGFRRAALVLGALALAAVAGAADPSPEPGVALTVKQAIAIALARHPARLAAGSREQAARERVGQARSHLLPAVSAVGEYLRATDNGIGHTTYLGAPGVTRVPTTGRHENQLTDTFDNYLGGISAYQYLFDFGRTRGLIEQRNAEADAEAARARLVDLDLVFAVSAAYYELVAAREIVKVFEHAVAQREQHLEEARVKARAGLRPEIDTYTAEAELARARTHLVDARNAAATAKAALDNAMGLGESALDYRQVDPLAYHEIDRPLPEFLATALARRPDLRMLEDEARATGAEIREYRSDYLPSVGAAAGYSVRGQDARPGNNFYAGLVVTWPLFNGFLTDHELAEARLRQDAIRHDLEGLRQKTILQVRRSYLDWTASVERIHRAEQTLAASRVELDLAQKRYETGLGSIIELPDAQRRLTGDQAAEVQARAGFSIAEAALARDTGTGLGEDDLGRGQSPTHEPR